MKYWTRSDPLRLTLPPELERIHNVFHVSQLKRYILDPGHVIPYQPLQIQEDISYVEKLAHILDRKAKQLGNKSIPLIKILWRSQQVEEATWKLEDEIQTSYPHLFHGTPSFEDEIF